MNQLIGYLSEGEQLKGSMTIPQKIGGGGGGTLETITKTYTPSTSQQTEQITPSSGYDGIAEVDVTVDAMPTGTLGNPVAVKGAVSNHSVSVTPTVLTQAGYISAQSKTGTAVTVSASELDSGTKPITANGNNQDVVGYAAVNVAVPNSYSAADEDKVVDNGALVAQTAHADVTPTTSDQTIDTTTNNSIKVKGDADLVAGNIKKDVTIFGVTGNYEGGGGGGSFPKTGTITPASRTTSITFDVGTTEEIKNLLVMPTSETALKSGGKTAYGFIANADLFTKSVIISSNNAGSSFLNPSWSISSTRFTQSGQTITVTSDAGSFETVSYTWFAW